MVCDSMITNSIVVVETGHNMKSFFLWSIFLTVITRGSLQGVCTDSGGNPVTDVSTSIETKVIFGTLAGGYSIVCHYQVTGSYNLYLWRLEKDNGGTLETIYTYFTATSPPTSQAGSNYASRNLSFQNNNTVVFPSLARSDVGSDMYRCTIQFNTAAVTCVESPIVDVNAKPDDITYQFGDLDSSETGDLDSDSLPIDKNIIITISGKNFFTSDMPSTSFIFNIGSNIMLNERITDLSNGFKEFNATVSYRTPSSYSEDISYHLYLVINDHSTEIDKGKFRTNPNVDLIGQQSTSSKQTGKQPATGESTAVATQASIRHKGQATDGHSGGRSRQEDNQDIETEGIQESEYVKFQHNVNQNTYEKISSNYQNTGFQMTPVDHHDKGGMLPAVPANHTYMDMSLPHHGPVDENTALTDK